METSIIIVTLGLCLPDRTWMEKVVEFEIDDDWENNPDGDFLRDRAFNQWCHNFIEKGPTAKYAKTAYEKGVAASKVSIDIAGCFVLTWEWKENAIGEERPDKSCDANCSRRLAGNDSVECDCSRADNEFDQKASVILSQANASLDDMNNNYCLNLSQQEALHGRISNALRKESGDKRKFEELYTALRSISSIGGNLPDDRHEGRTGPNDAHQRGMMYTSARRMANEALVLHNQPLDVSTYYKPEYQMKG